MSNLSNFKLYFEELPPKLRYKVAKPLKRVKKVMAKRRNRRKAIYGLGGGLILALGLCLIASQASAHNKSHSYQLKYQSWHSARLKLQRQLNQVEAEKTKSQAQIDQQAKDEAQLRSQINQLNAQLQAKASARLAAQTVVSLPPALPKLPQPTYQPAVTISGCGDNFYANFIYSHESGCRTTALNAIGCYGIGQACPGSKIAYCGADYACQNAFFSAYANSAYGGWAGAYAFWLAYRWW